MTRHRTVQLGEICTRLGVKERDARYVLEQGHVPRGVEPAPDSGTYRQFGPGQAFWFAIVLVLKINGIRVPLAARLATLADQALRTVTQNLGWEWQFLPSVGRFDTRHRYFLDLADLKHHRLVTDANPSGGGDLEPLDWQHVDRPGIAVNDLRPCVVLRLDLAWIAGRLAGAFGRADDDLPDAEEQR